MKRLINIRIPVVLAILLCAGSLTGYFYAQRNIKLFVIAALIALAVIIVAAVFCCRRKLILFAAVAFSAVFILGGLNSYLKISEFSKSEISDGATYKVTATVEDKTKVSYGEYIVVKNVKLNGKKISGKIKVNLSDTYGEFCETGYKVTFISQIYKCDTYTNGSLSYNAQKGVKYACNVNGGLKSEKKYSLFGSINGALRKVIFSNADYETAAVSYAMLTGNSDFIEEDTLSAFRYGGIAHMFAVSGLHIGLVFGMLSFIFKKLKLNKYLSAGIIIFCLVFYSGVCNFTLSSVRALIMCSVMLIAKLFNRKYDGLNSLAISVFIICAALPLSVFAVGFQLSVCAVLGILLLSKQICKPMKKAPYRIKSAVGVSFGAQAGTLPVMLSSFGYISGAGLLLNLIIIPLLSALFEILFVSALISLIIPPVSKFIMPYTTLPLSAVISFLTGAGFEKAIITGFGSGLFVPLYFAFILILSDRINLKKTKRAIIAVSLSAVIVIYTLIRIYLPFGGYKVYIKTVNGGGQTLIKYGGQNVLVIMDGAANSNASKFMCDNYAPDIDAVIILGGENCLTEYDELDVAAKRIYIYGGYTPVNPLEDGRIYYENEFEISDVNYKFCDGYNLETKLGGKTVKVSANGLIDGDDYDLLITAKPCDADLYKTVYFDNGGAIYSANNYKNFTVTIRDGNLRLPK